MQLITEEGKGCSFILNLPLKENTRYETGGQKQLVKYELGNSEITQQLDTSEKSNTFSILVVEDNGDLRALLKTILGRYYKVITANSGEQAITLLEDLVTDLIITDVSMPGISGIELTKQLKQDPKYRQIPIIVMTAYVDRKYQMESILSGADAFSQSRLTNPCFWHK